MDINDYINKLWSSLLADDVPSDFGNVTYYGLLKDTLLIVKRLYNEWIVKDETFNKQIETTIELLNSATELLNSIGVSVEEVEKKYADFTKAITEQQNTFENSVNQEIETIKNEIDVIIQDYTNSPEFKTLLTDKVDEILQGVGFKTLLQDIIAKTTIEFSKVNVSGSNATLFKSAVSTSGALMRNGTTIERTMSKTLYLANGIGLYAYKNNNELCKVIIVSNNNKFTIGNTTNILNIESSSRPNLTIGSVSQQMAFSSDLINYINRATPSIPATSTFKIGDRTAISSNSSNNNVRLGDFDYPLYLAVKDINTRPKMYTKSGVSFDLSTKNDVTAEVTKQLNTFVDKIYHVGRIIETIDKTFDPNTIIGHWELYGKGRVTICVDKDNSLMNEAGMTLGEAEVTLTVDEMPEHNHPQSVPELIQNTATGSVQYGYIANGAKIETEMSGSGQPHNNMQPSITVYRWIRIS